MKTWQASSIRPCTKEYARAAAEVGAELGIPVADLHQGLKGGACQILLATSSNYPFLTHAS